MKHKVFLDKIRPFQDKVYRFAKRLLISEDETQDTLQELTLRLWKQHNQIEKITNLEAYAMTLTKNLCLDKLKAKSTVTISLSDYPYQSTSLESLEKQLEDKDMLGFVRKSIEELSEQQRMVIQLRDIEQYEFEEIEQITGIKEATIRVILSRARKTIREKLTKIDYY